MSDKVRDDLLHEKHLESCFPLDPVVAENHVTVYYLMLNVGCWYRSYYVFVSKVMGLKYVRRMNRWGHVKRGT